MSTTKKKDESMRIHLSLRPVVFNAAMKVVNESGRYKRIHDYILDVLCDDLFRVGLLTDLRYKSMRLPREQTPKV